MKLETSRLVIRHLKESDWQAMKSVFVDFNNSKYAAYDMPLPTEDEEAKVLTKRFTASKLFFTVFLKESNEMIGYICFHKDGNTYDLGYCFHSAYHSKGYAYESTNALVKYFADKCGVTNFAAGTAIDNITSCKLLEKLGFACVSIETVSFDNAFSFQGGNFVLNISETNLNLKENFGMKIEIYPLDKVVIDGVEIFLGMEQSAVETAIGKGQLIGKRCYYFNSEMAIDYSNNKVEYIEFMCGVDGMLKPAIYGISAFETQANDLFEVLKERNNGAIGDNENGYSYQFQNISVGVYRESVPEEIKEMIEEAVSFGEPMSDHEIEYEMKRANHWATIGVGVAGYYQ